MKGHIRKKGARYYLEIERGRQPAQQCTGCKKLHWPERRRFDACVRCRGALVDVERRRTDYVPGSFARKKDAEAALRDALGKLEAGTWTSPTRVKLREYLEEWLVGASTTRSPNTLALYRTHVEAYIIPALGDVLLRDLSPGQINDFYSKQRKRLSATTVRHSHSVLRCALGDAVRHGLIARNPASLAKPPKPQKRAMHTWTGVELGRFLAAVKDDPLYPVWLLSATTGMRRGEVLGLKWRNVDLDAGRLSVSGSVVLIDNRPTLVETNKSARSRRSVALDTWTVTALKAQRARQAEERLALGANYFDRDLVFARPTGDPLHPIEVTRAFAARARSLDLPRIRYHDLRHTWASLALSAGEHPKVVQERLGHSTIALTLDTYSHLVPEMQEGAAERVASSFLGGGAR